VPYAERVGTGLSVRPVELPLSTELRYGLELAGHVGYPAFLPTRAEAHAPPVLPVPELADDTGRRAAQIVEEEPAWSG
jgi:hypothetical protein